MLMTLDGPAVIQAKPDIGRKSQLVRQLEGYPPEYCHNMWCGVEKLESCGYPTAIFYSFRQNT